MAFDSEQFIPSTSSTVGDMGRGGDFGKVPAEELLEAPCGGLLAANDDVVVSGGPVSASWAPTGSAGSSLWISAIGCTASPATVASWDLR